MFEFAGSSNVLLVISDTGWKRFRGSKNVGVSQTVLLISVVVSLCRSATFNHIQLLKPFTPSNSGTWMTKNTS